MAIVILASSALGHTVAVGPVHKLHRPAVTFQSFGAADVRAAPLGRQLRLHVEGAPFTLFLLMLPT